MTVSLVSAGSVAAGSTSVTPSFGASTTSGNLLVAFVMSNDSDSGEGGFIAVSDETWWLAYSGGAPYNWAAIWYKKDCGSGETAPTFSDGGPNSYVVAQLAEFSGCANSEVDAKGGGWGFPSSTTADGRDAAAGDLIVGMGVWNGGNAVTGMAAQITGSQGGNLTTNTLASNSSSTPPQFITAYAIGDSTLGSDADTFAGSFSTGSDNTPVNLIASFKAA